MQTRKLKVPQTRGIQKSIRIKLQKYNQNMVHCMYHYFEELEYSTYIKNEGVIKIDKKIMHSN